VCYTDVRFSLVCYTDVRFSLVCYTDVRFSFLHYVLNTFMWPREQGDGRDIYG